MTPDDLRLLLRRLADHLAKLHEDLEEDSLHAARQSQTGVRSGTTGSKPPCSITDLDYLTTSEEREDKPSPWVIVRRWCTELQRCAGVTGQPFGQPLNVWAAWLSRNREVFLAQDWADAAVDELRELEAELRTRLYPNLTPRTPMPTGALPPRLTETEICQAYSVQPATVRQWKHRQKIRDTGATKRVLVHGQAEHHTLYERCDGTDWPTRKETA